MTDHEQNVLFMQQALSQAQTAFDLNEVPVGAIIVKNNKIIATGYNRKETDKCCTKHAEIIAIEAASKTLNTWRLQDCTLYVTLEPCIMCAGAIYQSSISQVCYGTNDPKGGATGSLYNIQSDQRLNHQFDVTSNILKENCAEILQRFFKNRREENKRIKALARMYSE